ncbi:MAG: TetR/AcrR family transcriptional regulator [Alphaproteobacteria bacterium]
MSKHKTRQINRIIGATLGLIEQNGLSNLSISNVAEASGVTRQTIYNYFPDVESIITQALDAHSKAMEDHQLGLLKATEGAENKLYALAEFHISNASAEHSSLSLEAGLPARVREQIAARTDTIKAELAHALAPQSKRPEVTAALLWAMIEGAAEAAAEHPKHKQYLLDTLSKAMQTIIRY